jgi:hypothetical protein
MDKLDFEVIGRINKAYDRISGNNINAIKELLDDITFKYYVILYLRNSLELEYLINMKGRNCTLSELHEFSKMTVEQMGMAKVALFDSFCYLEQALIIES